MLRYPHDIAFSRISSRHPEQCLRHFSIPEGSLRIVEDETTHASPLDVSGLRRVHGVFYLHNYGSNELRSSPPPRGLPYNPPGMSTSENHAPLSGRYAPCTSPTWRSCQLSLRDETLDSGGDAWLMWRPSPGHRAVRCWPIRGSWSLGSKRLNSMGRTKNERGRQAPAAESSGAESSSLPLPRFGNSLLRH